MFYRIRSQRIDKCTFISKVKLRGTFHDGYKFIKSVKGILIKSKTFRGFVATLRTKKGVLYIIAYKYIRLNLII